MTSLHHSLNLLRLIRLLILYLHDNTATQSFIVTRSLLRYDSMLMCYTVVHTDLKQFSTFFLAQKCFIVFFELAYLMIICNLKGTGIHYFKVSKTQQYKNVRICSTKCAIAQAGPAPYLSRGLHSQVEKNT